MIISPVSFVRNIKPNVNFTARTNETSNQVPTDTFEKQSESKNISELEAKIKYIKREIDSLENIKLRISDQLWTVRHLGGSDRALEGDRWEMSLRIKRLRQELLSESIALLQQKAPDESKTDPLYEKIYQSEGKIYARDLIAEELKANASDEEEIEDEKKLRKRINDALEEYYFEGVEGSSDFEIRKILELIIQ